MGSIAAFVILVTVLITSFISGIFGMAGGLIMMGVLVALVPVSTAMIAHGVIQTFANGWRAWLLREHIDYKILIRYAIGSTISIIILAGVSWTPDKQILYVLLGLVPFLVWLPQKRFNLDIRKPSLALLAGLSVSGLNTVAGVAGPLLDLFFVKNNMTRQEIVSTKSITQVMSHLVKIVFWSFTLILATQPEDFPPYWLLLLAIPLSMMGTWLGGLILARMSDVNFKRWMKTLVTIIGFVFLYRAFTL